MGLWVDPVAVEREELLTAENSSDEVRGALDRYLGSHYLAFRMSILI